jgi:uncharacterized membrane protein (DUF4010 family)
LELDLATLGGFASALLIGALIGVEREKRALVEGDRGIGGLRTFILVAILGALGGWFAVVYQQLAFVGAALGATALFVLTGYWLGARHKPGSLGLTTEVAALVVCLLAAMIMLGHRELAVALAVVTAAVLAYKEPLHGLVERLGWDDVFAGVRLLLATFVVLPLLPDRALDPWGALNPRSLWLLVLLISGLSLIGYVATRWLGQHRGTAVTGLAGGLVSSTAVTLAFARQSREQAEGALRDRIGKALAGGVLLAWAVMFVRVLVEVAVVNADLLGRVLVPFAAMGAVAGGYAWWLMRAPSAGAPREDGVALRNPFSLTEAVKFAAFFALVLLVVKGVQLHFPGEGFYLVALLAGLTDVDAITLSMAEYAKTGDAAIAVDSIVIAAAANTVVKTVMVASLGSPAMRRAVLLAAAGVVLAGLGTALRV